MLLAIGVFHIAAISESKPGGLAVMNFLVAVMLYGRIFYPNYPRGEPGRGEVLLGDAMVVLLRRLDLGAQRRDRDVLLEITIIVLYCVWVIVSAFGWWWILLGGS